MKKSTRRKSSKNKKKNKKVVLYSIILVVLIILLVILHFCYKNKNLEFSVGECDPDIAYNKSAQGIREITWLDESTVQVKAYVSINCAEEIKGGYYKIIGDKMLLMYKSSTCWWVCASCKCAHELTFKIENLKKKDYVFSLKRK